MELVAFMFTNVITNIKIMPFSLKLVTQNIHPNFLSIQKIQKATTLHQLDSIKFLMWCQTHQRRSINGVDNPSKHINAENFPIFLNVQFNHMQV
jgi:hypothetical protein